MSILLVRAKQEITEGPATVLLPRSIQMVGNCGRKARRRIKSEYAAEGRVAQRCRLIQKND